MPGANHRATRSSEALGSRGVPGWITGESARDTEHAGENTFSDKMTVKIVAFSSPFPHSIPQLVPLRPKQQRLVGGSTRESSEQRGGRQASHSCGGLVASARLKAALAPSSWLTSAQVSGSWVFHVCDLSSRPGQLSECIVEGGTPLHVVSSAEGKTPLARFFLLDLTANFLATIFYLY